MAKENHVLDMIRQRFPGYHPLLSMAEIAHDRDADLRLQFECHKQIAKYVEPELKSVEVKGNLDQHKTVTIELFPGDYEEKREALALDSAVDAEYSDERD